MIFQQSSLYACHYTNFHNDKHPLLFILYSDASYTIGLNTHYIQKSDYNKLIKLIAKLKLNKTLSNKFFKQPREFYHSVLKKEIPEIIEQSYRMYHSMWLMGVPAHAGLYNQIGSKWSKYKGKKYKKEIITKDIYITKFKDSLKSEIEREKEILQKYKKFYTDNRSKNGRRRRKKGKIST